MAFLLLNRTLTNSSSQTLLHFLHSQPHQTKPQTLNSSRLSTQIIATQLSNCTNSLQLNQIHAKIITHDDPNLLSNPYLWNNIIRCYVRLNSPYTALGVYVSMVRANVRPDFHTVPIVLKAICQVFDVRAGFQVHGSAVKLGLDLNEYCESGFTNLYAKAGDLGTARRVFEQSPERKLGSWNAIISGLTHGGHAKEAITMFIGSRTM